MKESPSRIFFFLSFPLLKRFLAIALVFVQYSQPVEGESPQSASDTVKSGATSDQQDLSQFKTVQDLSEHLLVLFRSPLPSREVLMAKLQSVVDEANQRFPNQKAELATMQCNFLDMQAEIGVDPVKLGIGYQKLASDPATPNYIKSVADYRIIRPKLDSLLKSPNPNQGRWDEVDRMITTYSIRHEGYTYDIVVMMRRNELEALRNAHATDRLNALLDKLKRDKDPALVALAQAETADRLSPEDLMHSLKLNLTTIDGRQFDIEKLRGKVVLLVFWATWCGPCCAEIPKEKELYEKFHNQGLEILSISEDDDYGAMVKYVKKSELPWPQYFSSGWDNRLRTSLNIDSIPSLWLLDKNGVVVEKDLKSTDQLEGVIEELIRGRRFP